MRIFKLKLFNKWAKKETLTENGLKQAIQEMEKGLVDADLGGMFTKNESVSKGEVNGVECEQ